MGANNLYFPSTIQTKTVIPTNYIIVDNEKTGQPYKIYVEDFISSILEQGLIEIEDELTSDELAAINGADTPSALNVFVTTDALAEVAFSGDYGDLINTPAIPTATSDLTNDSGFISTNIYTGNGSLGANRTVSQAGFSLTFSNGEVRTISPSASALDTAFGTRNSTNTMWMSQVDGAGNTRLGGIGNTGARFGARGSDDDGSSINTLLTNLTGNYLFELRNDGGLFTNLGNYRQFKFGLDNYFETVSGSAWYRGNGVGYFNVNATGGINFESTNFGGNQARAVAKVQFEPPSSKIHSLYIPKTAASVSAITMAAGDEGGLTYVNTTNGTFTSTGFWYWNGSTWIFLG